MAEAHSSSVGLSTAALAQVPLQREICGPCRLSCGRGRCRLGWEAVAVRACPCAHRCPAGFGGLLPRISRRAVWSVHTPGREP
eukprot:5293826-Prymnesium_polylepis.3